MQATLQRKTRNKDGTFGLLTTDSGFVCVTVELDWQNNEVGKSCIPEGTYTCTYRLSPAHGMCYHIENVPDRTNCEIHAANFAHELLGCIAPGHEVIQLNGLPAVSKSRDTLAALEDNLNRETFTLVIKEIE